MKKQQSLSLPISLSSTNQSDITTSISSYDQPFDSGTQLPLTPRPSELVALEPNAPIDGQEKLKRTNDRLRGRTSHTEAENAEPRRVSDENSADIKQLDTSIEDVLNFAGLPDSFYYKLKEASSLLAASKRGLR
ncbi:hypothetical protein BKA67DRAFT_534752 [Truncatella angustata]|uniref:Uncharacterized protein n=1 Tax=Truncatella angustata TaxID=152316 RepID=A0A9P8UP97_9PEZI|nr:uncharacterized protein BKA67DRAFT_534752 [Truncatella angustata]KAH6655847.1 hypothetical protein BKA67DRAFT_534752 [Truncatella angustata]